MSASLQIHRHFQPPSLPAAAPMARFRLLIIIALWGVSCCVAAQSAPTALTGATSSPVASVIAEVHRLHYAGQTEAALARADAYLANKPNDAQMRFLKGVILADSKRRGEAIQIFQKLVDDYPDLAEPYNNLAALYAAEGDYARARITLEQAVRANPSYATAHENLGDVYAALASQSYARAQKLEPVNGALESKLALVRELFKRVPEGAAAAASAAPK
jgi:tetratricopeptide (TPR) repeat protein